MSGRVRGWLAVLASCHLMLAGCASAPIAAPPAQPAATASVALAETSIGGRFSLQFRRNGEEKDQGWHGRFEWVNTPAHSTLLLLDPLGQTIAKIESTPEETLATLSDGRVFRGSSPEALTSSVLGFPIPVAAFPDWLVGRAHGSGTLVPSDGTTTLNEDNWHLLFANISGQPPQPHRIDLQHEAEAGSVRLRLVIE